MKQTLVWSLCLSLVGLTKLSIARVGTDPTDDFSFAMVSRDVTAYQMMTTDEVANIFQAHLDVFPKSQSKRLARHLLQLCQKYKFDPAFILSLIQVESSFRVKATSPVGARGLMQLMPATAEAIARRYGVRYTGARSLEDPFTNLSIGVAYLHKLRERYKNVHPYFTLAAYNMGPSKLDQLRSRPGFRPQGTKTYFEKIRNNVRKIRDGELKPRRGARV